MTNLSDPGPTPPGGHATGDVWWWRMLDDNGAEVATAEGRVEFPNRADAESWVGEYWADLAEEGVASVVLMQADREVYGPMSLSAG